MKKFDPEDALEDLEFLDSTGVGATDAAERVGFANAEAMEKWLRRKGHPALWSRFMHRDHPGTHDSDSRKRRRLMEAPERIETIAALIATAQQSTRARTRNRADKVSDLIADLRTTLAAEREEDDRRESARKEVQRLEKALAEAKATLRGGSPTTLDVDSSVSAADLREWAKANGVECGPIGRVPASVREQYEAAQEQAAS